MRKNNKIYSIDEIRLLIADILKNYGIQKAYIFGSYARGEAKSNSDVDIMIKRGNSKLTLITLGKLFDELENKLKKSVDIVTEETYTEDIKYDNVAKKQSKKIFYNEVLNDRVKIYG